MTEHDLQEGIERVLEILANGDYENLEIQFFKKLLDDDRTIKGVIRIRKFNTPVIEEEKKDAE